MRSPDDVLLGIGAGSEGAMLALLERAGSDSRANIALAQIVTATALGREPLLITIYESRNFPFAAALGSRLCGPVGLHIGAVTPESIALAIVSEIHAPLAGRQVQRCPMYPTRRRFE
jgi:hypothetical protein